MSVEKFEFVYDDRPICLLDSLPIIYHSIQDFQSMNTASGMELSDLYAGVKHCFDSQFINDAPEDTVAKWEGYLHITPNTTDSLSERKFRVLAKLNDFPPYTDRYLENKLTELCGTNNFRITRDYGNYNLTIEISLDSLANTTTVMKLVRDIIPANLNLTVKELRVRYSEVAMFTHDELSTYTQNEISHGAMID